MNLVAQYRAWLDEELADREEGDFTRPGLILALVRLRELIESRPAVEGGHCGIVAVYPPNHWVVCWQDEGHEGGHDA